MTKTLRLIGAVLVLALGAGAARAADEAGFRAWLEAYKAEAREQGIKPETLEQAFAAIKFNARIIELDSQQPEFTKPVWEYIASVVTEDALRKARQ